MAAEAPCAWQAVRVSLAVVRPARQGAVALDVVRDVAVRRWDDARSTALIGRHARFPGEATRSTTSCAATRHLGAALVDAVAGGTAAVTSRAVIPVRTPLRSDGLVDGGFRRDAAAGLPLCERAITTCARNAERQHQEPQEVRLRAVLVLSEHLPLALGDTLSSAKEPSRELEKPEAGSGGRSRFPSAPAAWLCASALYIAGRCVMLRRMCDRARSGATDHVQR